MKWKEESIVTRKELASYLNTLASRIASRALTVQEQQVVIPDVELRYTLKYKEEGPVGTLTVKVEWGEEEEEPEEEEQEEEEQ
ncbi:MAG: amphi-Trp domain-containing protein [Limnochordales bacterium]|nr:amphi-Trp domain-containing protein [Limnochordales bacterium]